MVNMAKDWKKEVARDSIALGSFPFYFIVIIRAIIGKNVAFVYQLLVALVVLILISRFVKEIDNYVSKSLVIFFFTSLFYNEIVYTIFAFLLWGVVVYSSYYLKKSWSQIVRGIVFGAVGSGIAYYVVPLVI